ncbi:methyl-accepting chemotaxis protein [Pseudomonas fluorescens]|uniref:Methyl-accepting chemotaxis protein n=1 Tax=Pseudomonas fluorescens TaxID=294 RepID=A0A5E7EBT7_PSEFL|nr:methyl-accepting chemotaxis protein [Pseudomonas fluorescens]VVO24168.1 hypothetical protein PS723_04456 [Pseudomonas fluorescens]
MFDWIRNIRVSAKLALGFGLVLGLTSLIAITGWIAINALTDRSDKLASISSVGDLTRDLRINRLTIELHPDGAAGKSVIVVLNELDKVLEIARNQLVELGDIALVEQQRSAARDYRDAFSDMASEKSMSKDGAISTQVLARLQKQGDVLLEAGDQLMSSQIAKRNADSSRAKSMLGIVTALALLLGTIAAWSITRQIVIPLQQALKDVDRIAAGDLSQDVDVGRSDELGKLQASMQQMTISLRELIGGLGASITQIASAAEELSAVTEQTSVGVHSQKVETDQVATAMNEMAATVQEVARNAEEASVAAVAADQQAREGDQVVCEAIAQIDRLAAEIGNSTEAMNHLKDESDKIGGVLDVIKSVAQQTNLLALNAAIEAARAGEAGRGFAVVADEVRNLALRTQKSTEEIEGLIVGLQNGTQQVSEAMENSRTLTDSSVELTRRAGASLTSITRTVSTIQLMNQQIATAAEQQSAVAEEINRSVLNVRDISEQTAGASDETAASSVELARLGNELQVMVSRFRM